MGPATGVTHETRDEHNPVLCQNCRRLADGEVVCFDGHWFCGTDCLDQWYDRAVADYSSL